MSPTNPSAPPSAATPAPPRRRRRRRRLAWGAALALLLPLALLVWSALRDPLPRILERRSTLAAVREEAAEVLDGHLVQSVRVTAASGLAVDLLVKRPLADTGGTVARRPLVLLLGGHKTGRDAVGLIPETQGAVVAAMSYPYHGPHRVKGLAVLRHVPAIRRAIFDTPPAVLVALDYLLARPDVDAARVEGVGVSLGAPFMVIAGALDPRIARVWSIHGAAGSYGLLETNLRRAIPAAPPRAAVAGLASLLVAGPRMAPERWAPRIAPRPFVMVNATHDVQMPRPLVERLYDAAAEPKSLVWIPGGHVRSRPEVVRPLIDTVLGRMELGVE